MRAKTGRCFLGELHARLLGTLPGAQGVCRCALGCAQPGHDHGQALLVQVHCGFQAVATVVARAAGNPDGARVRRQRACEPCHGQPGALHQRVRGQVGSASKLDAARGCCVVERVWLVWADTVHGGWQLCPGAGRWAIVRQRAAFRNAVRPVLRGRCPGLFRRSDRPVRAHCRRPGTSRWRHGRG